MEISINQEQGLYVLHSPCGYSCMGFDNAMRETRTLADRLGQPDLAPLNEERGALSVMEKRSRLLALLAASKKDLGTWFDPRTPEKVRKILDAARKSGTKLRVFLGDAETGRDWLEESDVLGRIGRSTGLMKVPLMVEEGKSGGPAMLDHCIVRIVRASDCKELYRYQKYHQPRFTVERERKTKGYAAAVLADGKVHARFKSEGDAHLWVAFMMGATCCYPRG
ncbi:MAG: hypothetical protein A2286_00055 [Gammaproteobacteria bacterium RIFOXYA12_FULL_61_12]|nr:MAG: hypothetical protein A2514_11415 [Gammaproteobacteria bacterium RIFOXYD12_FULL_61_37]OGT90760.1 MAG: hypothetical protein A2286_00055 [Gammaproteobacteria bacterium RIFOXYA12_FULL_61_12]